jgi:hypothetical protein
LEGCWREKKSPTKYSPLLENVEKAITPEEFYPALKELKLQICICGSVVSLIGPTYDPSDF